MVFINLFHSTVHATYFPKSRYTFLQAQTDVVWTSISSQPADFVMFFFIAHQKMKEASLPDLTHVMCTVNSPDMSVSLRNVVHSELLQNDRVSQGYKVKIVIVIYLRTACTLTYRFASPVSSIQHQPWPSPCVLSVSPGPLSPDQPAASAAAGLLPGTTITSS